MRGFRQVGQYKKDLKLIAKRGYDLRKLNFALNELASGRTLPSRYRDHPLKGDWAGWRECHIEPDWLLIYRLTDDDVLLAGTGTHADLFNK